MGMGHPHYCESDYAISTHVCLRKLEAGQSEWEGVPDFFVR